MLRSVKHSKVSGINDSWVTVEKGMDTHCFKKFSGGKNWYYSAL